MDVRPIPSGGTDRADAAVRARYSRRAIPRRSSQALASDTTQGTVAILARRRNAEHVSPSFCPMRAKLSHAPEAASGGIVSCGFLWYSRYAASGRGARGLVVRAGGFVSPRRITNMARRGRAGKSPPELFPSKTPLERGQHLAFMERSLSQLGGRKHPCQSRS